MVIEGERSRESILYLLFPFTTIRFPFHFFVKSSPRQRTLEIRLLERGLTRKGTKLISFSLLSSRIRSNFIKTTYDISLDSQISFLPLGFSPPRVRKSLRKR